MMVLDVALGWFQKSLNVYSKSEPVKYFIIENQEYDWNENYLMNICEQWLALNFMVLATELKLLIFKISVPSADGLKKFSFRKELKLFATSCKYLLNNDLRTK
jgi:hypothetical protein